MRKMRVRRPVSRASGASGFREQRAVTEQPIPRRRRRASRAAQPVPPIIADSGDRVVRAFRDFFETGLPNPNTRSAYSRAVDQFLQWCSDQGLRGVDQVEPGVVAAYFGQHSGSEATLLQHLAAIRTFFDTLMEGVLISFNPASSVRVAAPGTRRRAAPILAPEETRRFLESIDVSAVVGLRDRAIVGVMVYAFARVGAVVRLRREDYFERDGRYWFRLRQWGGGTHEVPAHRTAQRFVDAYLDEAPKVAPRSPLFRTVDRHRELTRAPLTRTDVLRMVKRRARAEGLPRGTSCRTFRATGIAAYLESGGSPEAAQAIAALKTPRSTRFYARDRGRRPIALEEVDRISI